MAPDQTDSLSPVLSRARVAVVGRGRLGTALCAALGAAGVQVRGPLGRDDRPEDARAFGLHPLQTFTSARSKPAEEALGRFAGREALL